MRQPHIGHTCSLAGQTADVPAALRKATSWSGSYWTRPTHGQQSAGRRGEPAREAPATKTTLAGDGAGRVVPARAERCLLRAWPGGWLPGSGRRCPHSRASVWGLSSPDPARPPWSETLRGTRGPRAHLLIRFRLVDGADDLLDGTPGLLPVGRRGQQRKPGVPEVPRSQHHQGAAPRNAPKPERQVAPAVPARPVLPQQHLRPRHRTGRARLGCRAALHALDPRAQLCRLGPQGTSLLRLAPAPQLPPLPQLRTPVPAARAHDPRRGVTEEGPGLGGSPC